MFPFKAYFQYSCSMDTYRALAWCIMEFCFWGAYYGVLLVLEKYVWGKYLDKLPRVLKHIYTLFIVVVGFTIFTFDDLSKLKDYLGVMFGLNGMPLMDNDFKFYCVNYGILLISAIIFATPIYPKVKEYKFIYP